MSRARAAPGAERPAAIDWNSVVLALDLARLSLWRARKRMILAVLGVSIGFGAIHALLILGRSAEARVQALLDSLGGDVVSLSISPPFDEMVPGRRRPGGQGPSDAAALPTREIGLGEAAALLAAMENVEAAAWVERACQRNRDTDALGELSRIAPGVQGLLSLHAASGRLLQAADEGRDTVVLGADAAAELRQKMPQAGLGSVIAVCGRAVRVVGILERHPGNDLLPELGINRSVLMLGRGPSAARSQDAVNLLARLRQGIDSRELAQRLRDRVASLFPRQSVSASAAWDVIRLRQEQTTLYSSFLAILGGVALAVGMLGIANMMLVSVTERTAEIGLRMAIGARRVDIVLQFIAEGVLICLLGSAVGLLVGAVAAKVVLGVAGIGMVLPLSVVAQATALALGCGIAAGAYPAFRAASLQPRQSLAAG